MELCYIIIIKYIPEDLISHEDLKLIIEHSFSSFRHPSITPIKNLKDFYILELFYGPTNSFKDIALQFIGNLYNYFLKKDNKFLNIICATSGDTGSAAIYSLKNQSNIKCIVLYPHNKISLIQKKQMITINNKNIYNIAVNGNFDDCQKIVKQILNETDNTTTVNSINWCRILIQITYYFYAYFSIINNDKNIKKINFSVPTGNFGDILAGYYAKKMGLPIDKLLIATNENDILYRFYNTGKYMIKPFIETLTPAMDITISSNFERLLYYLLNDDIKLKNLMHKLDVVGEFKIEDIILNKMKNDFLCESINNQEIKSTLNLIYKKYNYLCDPHTAVGIKAMLKLNKKCKETICLSTAHPGKFQEIILNAIPNISDEFIPLNLLLLYRKKEFYKLLEKEDVITYIKNVININ